MSAPSGRGSAPQGRGLAAPGRGITSPGRGPVPTGWDIAPMSWGPARMEWSFSTMGSGPAPMGLGPIPMGLGPAPMGLGPAPMGLGSMPMGLGQAPMGLGQAPMGLGQAPMRLGPAQMGRIPASMGRGPAAPKETSRGRIAGLFYKDEQGVLKQLPYSTSLFELDKFYIGRLSGNRILPLLNDCDKIVFTEKHNPSNRRVVGPERAQRYGIPGTVAEVLRTIEGLRNEEREAENQRRKDARERLRQLPTKN